MPPCDHTPIRTTIIISQTLVKNRKFSKVKIHRYFSVVNSLEKIQNFFFFEVKNLFIFFAKNKTLRSPLPRTTVSWKKIK